LGAKTSQPFGFFAEELFIFLNYFSEKEGFLKYLSNLNDIKSRFYMTFRFYFSILI